MGGFELVSEHPWFGGLSGLAISPDGSRLRAVSDRGHWITATLAHDSKERLVAFRSWRGASLRTPAGNPVRGDGRDAESLARGSGDTFLVSFERRHRIWQYPAAVDAPPRPVPTPRALANAPFNGGLEGIAVLADGTLLGVTERYANADGSLKGWFMGAGAARAVAYMPADGFRPTDLAAMPNGDVLLVERRFSLVGLRARLVRLPHRRLQQARRRAGARIHGESLALLRPPLPVDNFEGLALRTDRAGRTLLYLVSDNNFQPFQRTLLFQFRMMDDA